MFLTYVKVSGLPHAVAQQGSRGGSAPERHVAGLYGAGLDWEAL